MTTKEGNDKWKVQDVVFCLPNCIDESRVFESLFR